MTLVKTPSVTQSLNFEQRFMALPHAAANGGPTVQMPENAALAPPSNYMLLVFNNQGVPSVAGIIGIG